MPATSASSGQPAQALPTALTCPGAQAVAAAAAAGCAAGQPLAQAAEQRRRRRRPAGALPRLAGDPAQGAGARPAHGPQRRLHTGRLQAPSCALGSGLAVWLSAAPRGDRWMLGFKRRAQQRCGLARLASWAT